MADITKDDLKVNDIVIFEKASQFSADGTQGWRGRVRGLDEDVTGRELADNEVCLGIDGVVTIDKILQIRGHIDE